MARPRNNPAVAHDEKSKMNLWYFDGSSHAPYLHELHHLPAVSYFVVRNSSEEGLMTQAMHLWYRGHQRCLLCEGNPVLHHCPAYPFLPPATRIGYLGVSSKFIEAELPVESKPLGLGENDDVWQTETPLGVWMLAIRKWLDVSTRVRTP